MRRWWLLVPVVVVLAACSDAPSGDAIEAAVEKVSAAPVPEGSSDRFEPDEFASSGVRIGQTNTWQVEMCTDSSCPFVIRNFMPLTFATLDEACAEVGTYVEAVGGSQAPASCPPAGIAAEIAAGGPEGVVSDVGVVVVPDGEFGNTVVFTLVHSRTDTVVELGIGQQFCSDTSAAQACTSP